MNKWTARAERRKRKRGKKGMRAADELGGKASIIIIIIIIFVHSTAHSTAQYTRHHAYISLRIFWSIRIPFAFYTGLD